MVANDPHVVADGAERLDGGVVDFGLVERIVVGQRRALNGIAQIGNVEVVAVLRPHLLDIGGNAGQTAAVAAALFIAGGVIRRIDLAVQVRGYEEREIDGLVRGGDFRTFELQFKNVQIASVVCIVCCNRLRDTDGNAFRIRGSFGEFHGRSQRLVKRSYLCGGRGKALVGGSPRRSAIGRDLNLKGRGSFAVVAEGGAENKVLIIRCLDGELQIAVLFRCTEILGAVPRLSGKVPIGAGSNAKGAIRVELVAAVKHGKFHVRKDVTCAIVGQTRTACPSYQCFCFSLRRFCADCRNKQSHNQNQSQKQG